MNTIGYHFRDVFSDRIGVAEEGLLLKQAAINRDMASWTEAMTNLVVDCCNYIGWQCCARWNPNQALPRVQKEYFTLDVSAFDGNRSGWQFPVATLELENMSSRKKIAYCLWKLLAVISQFRCLICYCELGEERNALLKYLKENVIDDLTVQERNQIFGETFICIGTRDDADFFPNGFFRWWNLNLNTTRFEVI